MAETKVISRSIGAFVQPAVGGEATVAIYSAIDWLRIGIWLYIPGGGIYEITDIAFSDCTLLLRMAEAAEGEEVEAGVVFPVNKRAVLGSDSIEITDAGVVSFTGNYGTGNTNLSAHGITAGLNNYIDGDGGLVVGTGSSVTASHPGHMSLAVGYNCKAGNSSIAVGHTSSACATPSYGVMCSAAIGYLCTASGPQSVAMGYYCTSSGLGALSVGGYARALADYAVALGANSISRGYGSFMSGVTSGTGAYSYVEAVFGLHPVAYSGYSTTLWQAKDRLFVIANTQTVGSAGAIVGQRTHAFTMWKNGHLQLGTTAAPADNGNVLNVMGRISADLPVYATDAAADADAALPSRSFYKLTGSHAVYQKP